MSYANEPAQLSAYKNRMTKRRFLEDDAGSNPDEELRVLRAASRKRRLRAIADAAAHGGADVATTIQYFRGVLFLDQAGLANELGVNQSTISRWESGKSVPDPAQAMALAKLFGKPVEWFLGKDNGADAPPAAEADQDASAPRAAPFAASPPLTSLVRPGAALVGDRDLPVYASAEGGPNGAMIVTYDPIEWVKRPEPLMTVRTGFAIYIVNDSMIPAFRPGDRALVHPLRQPLPGDDGLFIGEKQDGASYALVKTLISSSDEAWQVQQYNPADSFLLSKKTWHTAMKIVGKYGR